MPLNIKSYSGTILFASYYVYLSDVLRLDVTASMVEANSPLWVRFGRFTLSMIWSALPPESGHQIRKCEIDAKIVR